MRGKATFPPMGFYTSVFEYLIRELDYEPITPPKITQETIKLGVRHSSDFICYPFKTTLGSLIQGLEKGADTIICSGVSQGNCIPTCRFSFYYHIQEQILRDLGYNFNIHYIQGDGLKVIKSMRKINPKLSYLKCWKIIKEFYNKCKVIEKTHYTFVKKDVNIGLVGEFYTLMEHGINYSIINKLKKMGVGVHLSIPLSWFLLHQINRTKEDEEIIKEVGKYMPKRIGGHGWESCYNTIKYAKEGFDGVIHLLPLSCAPESLVEMPMNYISKDYNIPIYRFPLDENVFEAGFNTRLETFIKLLRRNKKCISV